LEGWEKKKKLNGVLIKGDKSEMGPGARVLWESVRLSVVVSIDTQCKSLREGGEKKQAGTST